MLKYIILGIVQGLTEFLPVSSSAHLAIIQHIFKIIEHQLALSVVLHLGTVLALVVFFFKDILNLCRDMRMLLMISLVTLITGIIALSGKDFFEGLFSSPKFAAGALIFTGIILLSTKKFINTNRAAVGFKDAAILGFSQALSIIPGISRSGITISTLLFRGVEPKTSFKFSFLVSIPAVLGAVILEAKEIGFVLRGEFKNLALGLFCSFLSGLLALAVLRVILRNAKFHYFGYYCILVAVITLLFIR